MNSILTYLNTPNETGDLDDGVQMADGLNLARRRMIKLELYRDLLLEYVASNATNDTQQD